MKTTRRKFLGSVAALLGLALVPTVIMPPWEEALAANTLRVGMNMAGLSSTSCFKNIVKGAGLWGGTANITGHRYDTQTNPDKFLLDTNGYLQTMTIQNPVGGETTFTEVDLAANFAMISGVYRTGTYVVMFDGTDSGTWNFTSGGSDATSPAPGNFSGKLGPANRYVMQVITATSQGLRFGFSTITGTPPSNLICVYSPGSTTTAQGPNELAVIADPLSFDNDFFNLCKPFDTLRFLNWYGIVNFNHQQNWDQRTLVSNLFWNVAPPEAAIALCNQIGCNLWIQTPWAASTDYMKKLATLVKNTFTAPGKKIYVEYGNEPFLDFFGGDLYFYEIYAGRALFTYPASGPGGPGDNSCANQFCVNRSAQNNIAWASVFTGADRSRIIPMVSGNGAGTGWTDFALNALPSDTSTWGFTHFDDFDVLTDVKNSNATNPTALVTPGSPGTFNWKGHGFAAGTKIRLEISNNGGVFYTGITSGTDYFIPSAGLTADSFRLSTTSGTGGTPVNVSGSQTGYMTMIAFLSGGSKGGAAHLYADACCVAPYYGAGYAVPAAWSGLADNGAAKFHVQAQTGGAIPTSSGANNTTFTFSALTVSGAIAGTGGKVRLTVSNTATVNTARTFRVSGVGGVLTSAGDWPVTIFSAGAPGTIELTGSVFAEVYTSGGTVSDLTDTLQPVLTVTGAVSGTSDRIRLTVSNTATINIAHTYQVAGVGGVPNSTGSSWSVTIVSAGAPGTIELTGSVFTTAYTSGGTAQDVDSFSLSTSGDTFWGNGGIAATPANATPARCHLHATAGANPVLKVDGGSTFPFLSNGDPVSGEDGSPLASAPVGFYPIFFTSVTAANATPTPAWRTIGVDSPVDSRGWIAEAYLQNAFFNNNYTANKVLTDAAGVQIISYEGGPGLGNFGGPNATTILSAAKTSSSMYATTTQMLTQTQTISPVSLFCYYQLLGLPTGNNQWGALTSQLDTTSPTYQALVDFATAGGGGRSWLGRF